MKSSEENINLLKSYVKELAGSLKTISEDSDFLSNVDSAIGLIGKCLVGGNKVLVAGNGGSAADAQHFAAEIVGRYKMERPGYPTIALTTDTSIITAWSNDYSFSTLFSRQIEALGVPGDIFIGISTSGNSQNVIEGVEKAKNKNMKTICLLGRDGGKLGGLSDLSIIVPSENTPRIQEIHTLVLHSIAEEIERRFLQKPAPQ